MSPILTGVIASGISGHLTPPWSPEGAYDALATIIVPSGGASSIDFVGIPSGYKHLEIRALARDARTPVTYGAFSMRFNGDTGSNYSWHQMFGDGRSSAVNVDNAASQTSLYTANIPAAASLPNSFGAVVIDILDYSSVNKNKVVRAIGGYESDTYGWSNVYSSTFLNSGAWYNSSSPITSISIIPATSPFQQNSHFALYGVK